MGREFFDHACEHAAHLLELTLSLPTSDPRRAGRLLRAANWLELAANLDSGLKTSALKNLGLAYMHRVKDGAPVPDPALDPVAAKAAVGRGGAPASELPGLHAPLLTWARAFDDASEARTGVVAVGGSSGFNRASLNLNPPVEDWKSWASQRFSDAWGSFLERPDAPSDGSYSQVKAIYGAIARTVRENRSLEETQAQKSGQKPPAGGEARIERKKKKRRKVAPSTSAEL